MDSWNELGRVGERVCCFRLDERFISFVLALSSLSEFERLREKFRRLVSTTERKSFERSIPLVAVELSTIAVPAWLINIVVFGVERLSSSSISSSSSVERKC